MGPLELTTRRELLAAFVGVGAPWAAACRRSSTLSYDGGFVGDNRVAGHAWRDGHWNLLAPALRPHRTEVLILGAGAAGLVTGWRLRKSGVDDLKVLDLALQPGGTAVGGRSTVTGYPWGAHYLPAPGRHNSDLVELLTDMGLVVGVRDDGEPVYEEAVLCASPHERVFYKGRWYAGLMHEAMGSETDRRQLAAFRRRVDDWIAFRGEDGRRAFTLPVAGCSDDPRARALDQQSMAEWLEREGLRSPLVRAAVDYACRDDFGARPSEVSAWYGLHYFAARTPSPGAESAPFLTWPDGNATLIRYLADRVGVDRIRLGTLVTAIRPDATEREMWRVDTVDVATQQRQTWRARQVVCALPSFMRSRLLPAEMVGEYRPTYGAWLVANLHLSGRPDSYGFESAWDNVVHESPSLGYVVATHQRGSAFGPTVWTWYLPLAGQDVTAERKRLAQLSWSDAAHLAVRELDATHIDLARYLTRVDVRRWGHAMVRPEPGLAFDTARRRAARSIGGLHFAHADLSGVALFEEAFYQGNRAAKAVLHRRGRPT